MDTRSKHPRSADEVRAVNPSRRGFVAVKPSARYLGDIARRNGR